MVKQLDNFKMDILKITGLSDLFKKKKSHKKINCLWALFFITRDWENINQTMHKH